MRHTTDALPTLVSRRRVLVLLGGAGLLAACGSNATDGAATTAASSTTTSGRGTTASSSTSTAATTAGTTTAAATTAGTTAGGDLTLTPAETSGPFPADGSNDNGAGGTADVLSDPGAVRRDIRGDIDGSNVQDGVPLTLRVQVLRQSGAALPGAAVYVWHCNKVGEYSAYNSRMLGGDFSERSFLRGVQIADGNGDVTFQTILPGRYPGRAFHIHFQVYADGSYGDKLLTSQMAMDDDLADALFAESGYAEALASDTDNEEDNIFADGVDHQLLTVTGDVASGLTATFTAVV